MSFVKKLLGKKKPAKVELDHAPVLIMLFEENETSEKDVAKFKTICETEGWEYEPKVAEHLKSALLRRMKELQCDASLHAYTDIVDHYIDKLAMFGLPDHLNGLLKEYMILEFYDYFLKKFKKVSKHFLWGIEYKALKYAVDKSRFGTGRQINTVSIEERMNIVGITSVKASARYIKTLLVGNKPRFDIIFNYHKDLTKLILKSRLAKSKEALEAMLEVTEDIYDGIQVHLLSPNADYSEGFYSRKDLYDLAVENMQSIKYSGRWKDELQRVYEQAELAVA